MSTLGLNNNNFQWGFLFSCSIFHDFVRSICVQFLGREVSLSLLPNQTRGKFLYLPLEVRLSSIHKHKFIGYTCRLRHIFFLMEYCVETRHLYQNPPPPPLHALHVLLILQSILISLCCDAILFVMINFKKASHWISLLMCCHLRAAGTTLTHLGPSGNNAMQRRLGQALKELTAPCRSSTTRYSSR